MSQREPAFYNLEFTENDAPFWAEAGSASRRTFLMPLPDPTSFVAFGVVGSDNTVLFVARGRVREHLGAFIAAMEGNSAGAELYARVPLPWHLVKRYTSDDPYENQETEGPREPPVRGLVAYGGGAEDGEACLEEGRTASLSTGSFGWPSGVLATTRRVYVMPGADADEFLAFGVCLSPERFVFLARGSRSTGLAGFRDRVKLEGVLLEDCTCPPLGFLDTYLKKYASLCQSYPGTTTLAAQSA